MLKGIGIGVGGLVLSYVIWMLIWGGGAVVSEKVSYDAKPEINIYSLEQEIYQLTNSERRGNAPLLSYDPALSDIARKHSQDMVNRHYFDHNTPEGKDPTKRGLDAGYRCYKDFGSYYMEGLAENLSKNNLYDSYTTINGIKSSYDWNTSSEIAQSTVQGWMGSSGHRENILDSTYDKVGIGVSIDQTNDQVLITQLFC